MCLTSIKRILKGGSRKEIGYKVVKGNFRDGMSPIYVDYPGGYWKKDKWYVAKYNEAKFISRKSNKQIWPQKDGTILQRLSWTLMKKGHKSDRIEAVIEYDNGVYPCGFHYFSTKKEAMSYNIGQAIGSKVVEIEAKNIVARGKQGYLAAGSASVCRKMRIIGYA